MPARRPGDFGLHLRHHRQAQGRHAFAPRPGLHRARLQHLGLARRNRRAHVLFAPVPHCRAHGRRVLCAVHRLQNQLRRKPRNHPRERARDRAHRVYRRAAGVGKVLLGRHDFAQRSRRPAAGGLCLGHWRGPAHCRLGAGGQARGPGPAHAVSDCAVAGAQQCAQAHRHPPRALFGDGRGAHFARTGALVPGTGRAHARSLGHDRDLRRIHWRAGHRHASGLDWPGGWF